MEGRVGWKAVPVALRCSCVLNVRVLFFRLRSLCFVEQYVVLVFDTGSSVERKTLVTLFEVGCKGFVQSFPTPFFYREIILQ